MSLIGDLLTVPSSGYVLGLRSQRGNEQAANDIFLCIASMIADREPSMGQCRLPARTLSARAPSPPPFCALSPAFSR